MLHLVAENGSLLLAPQTANISASDSASKEAKYVALDVKAGTAVRQGANPADALACICNSTQTCTAISYICQSYRCMALQSFAMLSTRSQVVMTDRLLHSSPPNMSQYTRAAWMPQFSAQPIRYCSSGQPVSLIVAMDG